MSQQTINTPRDSTFQSTEQTPRNLADVLADELAGIAGAIGNIGSDDYDDLTHRPQVNGITLTGNKSSADLGLASNSDLTSIIATGSTNTTGAKIDAGVFFYLNGTLVQAKADIASGATFTENTNYEEVTAGGLNALNSNLTVHTDTVDGVVFSRQGNIVSIFGYGISPASLPTIPEIYRPDDTMIFPVTSIASSKLYNAYMGITSAGAMNCNYSSTYGGSPTALTGGSIYFTVSYAV